MAQGSGSASNPFVTQQQPGQWLASKLIGTTVVGPNNESIGDVNDVLMDRNGQAVAVVVGVGGFLGIGEKDVAVSFNQLEFTSHGNVSTAATTGSTSATTASPSTTGSTAATASATDRGVPDRIVLRLTKQDLQNAPKFTRMSARENTTGATGAGGTTRSAGDRGTTGTAPAAPGGNNQAPKQ